MITGNYFELNKDLQFNFEKWVNWQNIVPLAENDFSDAKRYEKENDSRFEMAPSNVEEAVELYRVVLQQYGEICGKELAASAGEFDKTGLRFEKGKVHFPQRAIEILDLISESGILGYAIGREHGGIHLPLTMHCLLQEMISQADGGFAITVGCFNLAEVIARFGDEEMVNKYVPPMARGEMAGAMALTEPDYGSDLPHLQTRAEKDASGNWFITGTKRFITHGCGFGERPAAILTLARSGGEGAKGLSFFLVESTHVEISRIEEKMGLHISPTCEVVYDKAPALLIGEENRGLVKYAMAMMNGARLAIGVQALGMSQAAFAEAKKYASEREQFGKTIDQIGAVASLLDEMEAILHAFRALVYNTAEMVDLYDGLERKYHREGLSEREVRRQKDVIKYDKLAKLLTPMSKLFTTELGNKIVYDALQIFGGSGYTEEYDISKIYRDMRITPIYEGTSQLQVVAAVGGVVEGMRDTGALRAEISERIEKLENSRFEEKQFVKLEELVELYKEKEKEEKDKVAWYLVFFFAWFYSLLLFATQEQLAREEGDGIAEEKSRLLGIYRMVAAREMAAAEVQLRGVEA